MQDFVQGIVSSDQENITDSVTRIPLYDTSTNSDGHTPAGLPLEMCVDPDDPKNNLYLSLIALCGEASAMRSQAQAVFDAAVQALAEYCAAN